MKIVREKVYEGQKLDLSAGLVVIQDNKILLIHPTNAPWKNSFSIPKGHVEPGEDLLDAAIRETTEETGADASKFKIVDPTPLFIDYTNKKGELHKRVYYFLAYPRNKIKKSDLKPQKGEADWAGFLSAKEAKGKIFWRFKELLKYLK